MPCEAMAYTTSPWSSNRGRGRVPPGSESDGWMDGAVDKRAQI